MKFRVTVEIENAGERPWPESVGAKIDDWTAKLVTDRLSGIRRATRSVTKGPHRYKAVVSDVHVERDE